MHFYFKLENGQRVTVWHWNGVRAGELRGDGAYVVAPPSLHPSGNYYEWLIEPTGYLPNIPQALLELINSTPKQPLIETVMGRTDKGIPIAALVRRAVNRSVTKGRNNAGFYLACQLRDNGYGRDEAGSAMLEYARAVAASGTHGYAETEALRSLEQAFTRAPRPALRPIRKTHQFYKRRGVQRRIRRERR